MHGNGRRNGGCGHRLGRHESVPFRGGGRGNGRLRHQRETRLNAPIAFDDLNRHGPQTLNAGCPDRRLLVEILDVTAPADRDSMARIASVDRADSSMGSYFAAHFDARQAIARHGGTQSLRAGQAPAGICWRFFMGVRPEGPPP